MLEPPAPTDPPPPSTWQDLAHLYLDGKRGRAAILLAAFAFKFSPLWLLPLMTGLLIDLIGQPKDVALKWVAIYGGITLLVLVQNIPSHVIYIKQISHIGRETGRNLRLATCRQLQQMSLLYHERVGPGRLQTKLLRDVEKIEEFPSHFGNSVLPGITMLLATVVVIGLKAPAGLALFVLMVPVGVLLRRAFHRPLRDRADDYRRTLESMTGGLTEMVRLTPVTRAHGLEQRALDTADHHIHHAADQARRFDMIHGIFHSAAWVSFYVFQVLFLMASVGLAAAYGWFTPGEVVTFNMYFAAASNALQQLLQVMPQIATLKASHTSVQEVLDAPDIEHNTGKAAVTHVRGRVTFDRVTYTYPGADTPAITDLSFELEPGQQLAVVGPSGGGKSTLLALLLGFLRPNGLVPDSGRVLYDGQDGEQLDLRTWRQQLSVVTQSSVLFSGTVRDNIVYGQDHVSDARIQEALIQAQAHDFVPQLPQGLNTRLGEDGQQLSGGQTQRIAIARALLRNPALLVLDEPTSALDIESEQQVQAAITAAMGGKTCVLVSHSLPLVRHADVILVIEGGRLVARGTHEQLITGDHFYAQAVQARHAALATGP